LRFLNIMEINVLNEIHSLLDSCLENYISDIHLEEHEHKLLIRVRKDGLLKRYKELASGANLISRLKVMSKIDINNHLLCQDGRFTYKNIDIRASVVPTFWGCKMVLRLLNFDEQLLNIEKLGMPELVLQKTRKIIQKRAGLVLVCGPTGSGKTTTLYSIIRELNDPKYNITTIEDPVEYKLDSINQIQVNEDTGLTFPHLLKAILRQDPDIILIGEIRDLETAEIAIRASLTGHLVLTTLHTKNCQEAFVRLEEIGVSKNIAEQTIEAIISQKLVRVPCKKCGGTGCEFCEGDGYSGRTGIFEYYDDDFFYPFEKDSEKNFI